MLIHIARGRNLTVQPFCMEYCPLFLAQHPPVDRSLLIHEVSRSHTTRYHSRWDSSGRVISSSQRTLPGNTQHSQETDIYAPCGIRTHIVSRRAAADLRLRLRGNWDCHHCPFFLWRCDPTRVMAFSFTRFSRSHTTTHHSR